MKRQISWPLRWMLSASAIAVACASPEPNDVAPRGRLGGGGAPILPVVASGIEITPDGFWSEQPWAAEDDWEPAVAVAPDEEGVVHQLTTRYGTSFGTPDPAVVARRSLDSGWTWQADALLEAAPVTQNDPQVITASGGWVFAAWIEGFEPGVKVVRSSDSGVTWSAPITILQAGKPPDFSDKPILVASADGQRVWVAFNASDGWVASSDDFGASFGVPHRTSADGRYWFHNGGAVALDGAVWFTAVDYSQDYSGDSNIRLVTSPDGEPPWQTPTLDTSRELPPCTWDPGCPEGFLGPTSAVAVDAAGRIVVAYSAARVPNGTLHLYTRRSTDGGATWSPPVEISAGRGHHTFPALAAGPVPGDFRLAWQDDGAGTGFWNTRLARSTDGGLTWSAPVRLSDRGDGAPYKDPLGYVFPYGDYLELAVDSAGREHVIWGEGPGWQGPGNVWWTRRADALTIFEDGFESGGTGHWSAQDR
ncbi:MAG: sialidase family protein [Acidobacteriota bacterium]